MSVNKSQCIASWVSCIDNGREAHGPTAVCRQEAPAQGNYNQVQDISTTWCAGQDSHNADDGSANDQEYDQMQPPEALAMVLQSSFLATSNGAILGLGNLVLVGHFGWLEDRNTQQGIKKI